MSRNITAAMIVVLTQLSLASTAIAWAVNGLTSEWTPVIYPLLDPDPINDHQTGQSEADIVGTAGHAGFYTHFEFGATPAEDMLAFRFRLGTQESPAGFSHVAMIGLDADNDFTNDMFIMLDHSGTDEISLFTTGKKANDTPKNTSTKSTSYAYGETFLNFDWSPVSASNCSECTDPADYDLDGDGANDYFLSLAVPFVDVIAVLGMDGVTGITPDTLIRYVAGTSTNTNSFGQDMVGVDGDPNTTSGWSALGADSVQATIDPNSPFNPIPEPGTGTLLALGLCGLVIARLEGWQGSASSSPSAAVDHA